MLPHGADKIPAQSRDSWKSCLTVHVFSIQLFETLQIAHKFSLLISSELKTVSWEPLGEPQMADRSSLSGR